MQSRPLQETMCGSHHSRLTRPNPRPKVRAWVLGSSRETGVGYPSWDLSPLDHTGSFPAQSWPPWVSMHVPSWFPGLQKSVYLEWGSNQRLSIPGHLLINHPPFFHLLSLEEGFIMVISRKLPQKLLSNNHLGPACPCGLTIRHRSVCHFYSSIAKQNTAWGGRSAGSVVILSNIVIFILKDGDIVGG